MRKDAAGSGTVPQPTECPNGREPPGIKSDKRSKGSSGPATGGRQSKHRCGRCAGSKRRQASGHYRAAGASAAGHATGRHARPSGPSAKSCSSTSSRPDEATESSPSESTAAAQGSAVSKSDAGCEAPHASAKASTCRVTRSSSMLRRANNVCRKVSNRMEFRHKDRNFPANPTISADESTPRAKRDRRLRLDDRQKNPGHFSGIREDRSCRPRRYACGVGVSPDELPCPFAGLLPR